MKWISVNDRLPEMAERYDENTETNIVASDPVLVSKDGNCVMFGYFEEMDDEIVFMQVSENYNVFEDYQYELDEISHWMPLPAPAEIGSGLPLDDDLIKYVEEQKNKARESIAKAKQIHEYWLSERERIEREARANGTWQDVGLDANNHLFKEIDAEVKEKLKQLHLS